MRLAAVEQHANRKHAALPSSRPTALDFHRYIFSEIRPKGKMCVGKPIKLKFVNGKILEAPEDLDEVELTILPDAWAKKMQQT